MILGCTDDAKAVRRTDGADGFAQATSATLSNNNRALASIHQSTLGPWITHSGALGGTKAALAFTKDDRIPF